MKKNKELMLKLLNDKDTLTFKEISAKTGYHEKSLIRIKKMIENETYKLKSLTLKEKEYIKNLYLSSDIKMITKFYNYYLINNKTYPKRSYSTIQKIIKNQKNQNKSNYVIIGNIADRESFERYYFALDFDNKEILFFEKGFKKSYEEYFKILKYIQNNFKDKTIVFKGNSFLKNKNGTQYKSFINYLNKHKLSYNFKEIYLPKKTIEKIINTKSTNTLVEIDLIKDLFLEKIVISEEERKVFENNIIEYKNAGYKINIENNIPKGTNIKIIYYLFNKKPYAKIDDKIYNLIKIYSKESKKKYN